MLLVFAGTVEDDDPTVGVYVDDHEARNQDVNDEDAVDHEVQVTPNEIVFTQPFEVYQTHRQEHY